MSVRNDITIAKQDSRIKSTAIDTYNFFWFSLILFKNFKIISIF